MSIVSPLIQFGITATIASSGTTSEAIDLGSNQLVGFIMPSAFTGTAIGISASSAIDGTYVVAEDGDGANISIPVTASKYIPINDLALTAGMRFIKIISNASEGAERTITLSGRPV